MRKKVDADLPSSRLLPSRRGSLLISKVMSVFAAKVARQNLVQQGYRRRIGHSNA